MKILHLDRNHDSLINELKNSGYINVEGYKMKLAKVKSIIYKFDGIVIRSRFNIDSDFLKNARKIKFVARVVGWCFHVWLAQVTGNAQHWTSNRGNRVF